MRELGMWNSSDGIDQTFSYIEKLANNCRFSDCTHSEKEQGCAVQNAIRSGELSYDRFQSYIKLLNENKYIQDSEQYLVQKKQKFKEIAKINKKNKKDCKSY